MRAGCSLCERVRGEWFRRIFAPRRNVNRYACDERHPVRHGATPRSLSLSRALDLFLCFPGPIRMYFSHVLRLTYHIYKIYMCRYGIYVYSSCIYYSNIRVNGVTLQLIGIQRASQRAQWRRDITHPSVSFLAAVHVVLRAAFILRVLACVQNSIDHPTRISVPGQITHLYWICAPPNKRVACAHRTI